MIALPAGAMIVFMGLHLPAFGSADSALLSQGFVAVRVDQPSVEEGDSYVKVFRTKALGVVRVYAETKANTVDSFLVGCRRNHPCAKPMTPEMNCIRIDTTSWRCKYDQVNFEVHTCAHSAYFLTRLGAEYPRELCAALRPARPRR